MSTIAGVPADWHPDPTGRNQFRYWDGARWTDWVANDGAQTSDPLHPPAPAIDSTVHANRFSRPLRKPIADHETRHVYMLLGADGFANTEVAGEFARIDSIHAALGRKPKRDEEIEQTDLTVALVPEPSNRHDSNAVMVQINGQHVGYLEREVAAVYQPVVREVWDAGYVAATRGRIWAAARAEWDAPRKLKYVARVSLALNAPHLSIPVNDPPDAAYSILPWGAALQINGEEHHQDWLARYMNPQGDSIALATLREIVGGTERAPKVFVEVQLDGQRIGQLTPASSQHFLPVVRHLEGKEMYAACWVRIKGSVIASQATLQAMRSHELPADWFAEAETVPRLR